MDTTPTELSNPTDGVIHSFVFGGEEPSRETEHRATFVKSFLAAYYNTALQGTDYSLANPEGCGHAHTCNTTVACTTNSPCNASTTTTNYDCNNNNKEDTEGVQSLYAHSATEHPAMFAGINSADEAERLNSMRDMVAKLADKLGGMYRGMKTNNKGVAVPPPATAAATDLVRNVLKIPTSTPGATNEVGDLSQHLQLFVDNINESLHLLGTTELTEEELKLLLATAPLPTMDNNNNSNNGNNNNVATRPRSRSAAEILGKAPPIGLASRKLKHSKSEGVNLRHYTKETLASKPPSIVGSVIIEDDDKHNGDECGDNNNNSNTNNDANQRDGLSSSDGVVSGNNDASSLVMTRQRSCSVDADPSNANEGDNGGKPRKRLSSFFSKKMESFTNLLENIEFAEKDDSSHKVFTKSKSFNLGMRSGMVTPTLANTATIPTTMPNNNSNKSGYTSPVRSGYTTPFAPTSGYTTPEEGLNIAALKLKLELVEKALCDEVVVRTEAEKRATQLSDLIARMKSDMDRIQSEKDTVSVINKQMGVELRFLRQRNSRVTRDRQQWEDALVGETKKRRTLEEQMQMLIKSCQQRNFSEQNIDNGNNNNSNNDNNITSNNTKNNNNNNAKQQQEQAFAQQREEVLLAVIESLREQARVADVEMERAKIEWQEERAKYQESHDLLRFQLDQLTLTRQQTTQSVAGKDSEVSEQIDEAINNRDGIRRFRQLQHEMSMPDLLDKSSESPADVEVKKDIIDTPTKPKNPVTEKMKLFFLSSSWWPKFEFHNSSSSITNMSNNHIPTRPPVLLMQIAWWVSELREHVTAQQLMKEHSNQFCSCDECMIVAEKKGF